MEKYCMTFSNISDYRLWLREAKHYNIVSTFVMNDILVVTYTKEEIPHF